MKKTFHRKLPRNVPSECWLSIDDFWNMGTPQGLCPSSFEVTVPASEKQPHARPGQAGHTPTSGSALCPTKGPVRSRHMPQIKQHQATFYKQLVNMNVTGICDGQPGWQGALQSWTLTVGHQWIEPVAWKQQKCSQTHTQTHARTHGHVYMHTYMHPCTHTREWRGLSSKRTCFVFPEKVHWSSDFSLQLPSRP